MDEDSVRAALQHYFDYSAPDADVAHEIYDENPVLEFPESGERFEGVENFLERPARRRRQAVRMRGADDLRRNETATRAALPSRASYLANLDKWSLISGAGVGSRVTCAKQ